MSKTNRASDEKTAIVLEGLKGEIPITDLCRKHAISQTMYYKWRDKFFEGGKKSLISNGENSTTKSDKAKIEELERIIGKQAVEIQILKKNLNLI